MRWWESGVITLALMLAAPAYLRQFAWQVTAAPADTASGAAALAEVPANAPIVFHVRGVERTKDRLLAMIQNAVPDLAPMVKTKVDEAMKEGLEGRQLKGLPKDGSVFVVFPEMPKAGQEMPSMAIIVRVTDYKTFRDGILTEEERKALKVDKAGYDHATVERQDVFFVDRKDYAVVTPQKEVAAQFTKKQPGLDGQLAKETAATLMESDVAAYVDMGAVNKEYGDQIQAFKPLLEFGLQQAGGQLDKNSLDVVKAIFNGIFQFVEDSRGFLLAAEFRPEGLALHTQARIGADTKIDSYLKKSKPAAFTELSKLPAGRMGYWGVHIGPELAEAFQPFLTGMFADAEGKENKGIKEAMEMIQQAGPEGAVGEFNLPPQGLQVSHYKDPAKAAEGSVKMFQQMKEGATFRSGILKGKPEVKVNAENHRGFKLTYVSFTYDFDKMAEKAPQGGKELAEVMKTMLGEGVKAWSGTDGKVFVQITAKDWDTAKRSLDEFLDGKNAIGTQKAFAEALKQLPGQTTMLGLMDVPQYVQVFSEFMGPILKGQGLPVNIPPLKAAKGKSYSGMAMTLRPQLGSVVFWIPVTTVSDVRKMIEPVLKGAGIQ
jgi:hypothetical protein